MVLLVATIPISKRLLQLNSNLLNQKLSALAHQYCRVNNNTCQITNNQRYSLFNPINDKRCMSSSSSGKGNGDKKKPKPMIGDQEGKKSKEDTTINSEEAEPILDNVAPEDLSKNTFALSEELQVNDESTNTSSTSSGGNNNGALVKSRIPEFVPELIAVPVSRRPVFPGFYKTITVKDSRVTSSLMQSLKRGRPYIGLFLTNAEGEDAKNSLATGTGDSINSSDSNDRGDGGPGTGVVIGVGSRGGGGYSDDMDVIHSLNQIYRVGVFAQVINVINMPTEGATAIILPHRRIRALELLTPPDAPVSRIRVENVSDEPYERNSQMIRAITQEIYAVMADIAKLNPFFREHVTHHNVPPAVFEDSAKLADFCAVLSSSDPKELQALLEETVIEERLRMALVLLKKELVTAQLQHSISRDVEQKLNQRQREYFLNEQLKSIKKELGLETDSKEKLLEQFRKRAEQLHMNDIVKGVFDEVLAGVPALLPYKWLR